METLELSVNFWLGKRVLVTGHTGFKGSWLSEVLLSLGANVSGFSLESITDKVLFNQLNLSRRMVHIAGDLRDYSVLQDAVRSVQPEIIFHLAAQPLVRLSYREPLVTWNTNVMGTAHLLEAVRENNSPCSVVVVTTDKIYENRGLQYPYLETDQLGGYDPYSASKAATELAVASWRRAFLYGSKMRLATARAGNVIGGGDWSEDRILPDLARACRDNRILQIRNRYAVRPWQHVLDPLNGYLLLAEALTTNHSEQFESGFNFGPEPKDQRNVGELVQAALSYWPGGCNDVTEPSAPHEAQCLSLSIDKARNLLNWTPRWNFDEAVEATVVWYRDVEAGADPRMLVRQQISDFGFSE